MKITPINTISISSSDKNRKYNNNIKHEYGNKIETSFLPLYNVPFQADYRRVLDIDEKSYRTLSDTMKRLLRKKCENFTNTLNVSELANA